MPITVAIIPARGGSKGLPGKNLMKIGGVPLVGRAVRAALNARHIDAVFVSSDNPEILDCAAWYGATPIQRSEDISGDTASSEAVVLAALDHPDISALRPDIVVLLQCTSPFTRSAELDELVGSLEDERYEAALTVSADHGFLWTVSPEGFANGTNHNIAEPRQRRQDLSPQYRETGAAYAMRVESFRKNGSRFCGPVALAVTGHPPVEIDTPEDLMLARAIAAQHRDDGYPSEVFADIGALVTDFDGVHTDDSVWVDQDGVESVRCSRSDGMGIARLKAGGFAVLILSKEKNPVVARRAEKLNVPVVHGEDDKMSALENWVARTGLEMAHICFVGNDVNDVEAMRAAGLAVAPADARYEAKDAADIVLRSSGGQGAVREICEYLLNARQSWR